MLKKNKVKEWTHADAGKKVIRKTTLVFSSGELKVTSLYKFSTTCTSNLKYIEIIKLQDPPLFSVFSLKPKGEDKG